MKLGRLVLILSTIFFCFSLSSSVLASSRIIHGASTVKSTAKNGKAQYYDDVFMTNHTPYDYTLSLEFSDGGYDADYLYAYEQISIDMHFSRCVTYTLRYLSGFIKATNTVCISPAYPKVLIDIY